MSVKSIGLCCIGKHPGFRFDDATGMYGCVECRRTFEPGSEEIQSMLRSAIEKDRRDGRSHDPFPHETKESKARCVKCGGDDGVNENGYCWPCRMPKPPSSFRDPRAPLWPAYLIGSEREMPTAETKPSVPETKESNAETKRPEGEKPVTVGEAIRPIIDVLQRMHEERKRTVDRIDAAVMAELRKLLAEGKLNEPEPVQARDETDWKAWYAKAVDERKEVEHKLACALEDLDDCREKLAVAQSTAPGLMRSEVRWFAEQMEVTLREHHDKGGWNDCAIDWLAQRAREEVEELEAEVVAESHGRKFDPLLVIREAKSVAIYSMMIADVVRKKEKKE